MAEAVLIRTVRFTARHRYWRRGWTGEENRRVFGDNVVAHEHSWALTVRVKGEVDPESGFLIDLAELDSLLEELVAPLRGTDLTDSIREAREGELIPSTESLARWFLRRLEGRIPGHARLELVRVAESDELASEVEPAW